MKKKYFLFGSTPCNKLLNGEKITRKDLLTDGELFVYIEGETTPIELLNAFNGWGDYQELSETQYLKLSSLTKK